jgi:hypothetical protein
LDRTEHVLHGPFGIDTFLFHGWSESSGSGQKVTDRLSAWTSRLIRFAKSQLKGMTIEKTFAPLF